MGNVSNNINLYEDEIILMIAKGNEEALELLFSLYETKMRFEANSFSNKFKLPVVDKQDLLQEIKITLYDAILRYNYRNGRFYNYWYLIMNRTILGYLKKESIPSNDSRKHETYCEGRKYDEHVIFNDSLKFDYDLSVKMITNKKDELFSLCMKMWLVGYSYKEISKKLNITMTSVNYHIRKGLEDLKSIFGNDKK